MVKKCVLEANSKINDNIKIIINFDKYEKHFSFFLFFFFCSKVCLVYVLGNDDQTNLRLDRSKMLYVLPVWYVIHFVINKSAIENFVKSLKDVNSREFKTQMRWFLKIFSFLNHTVSMRALARPKLKLSQRKYKGTRRRSTCQLNAWLEQNINKI